MEKEITVYPLAWLKVSKLFSENGLMALSLKDWKPEVQEVFLAMRDAKIVVINERGFLRLRKRLPKGFREQMNKYA